MHPAAKLNFAFGPSMTSSSCVIAAAHTARSDGKSAAQRRIMPSDSAFQRASLTSSPSQLLLPEASWVPRSGPAQRLALLTTADTRVGVHERAEREDATLI